ncbi:hypothetical protein CSC70_03770 [Pseudoxanthomonas kalamensis DSM 18571]|uniref:DUF3426 domain-containing protein n=1 Tax=Pseudoxanthomonas kalamensis TaxID=289483 RepID=UPI001390CB6D|nr:DUF3426 domain-containing protein [Pseudoxanthomonas kalamensis]KAF1712627.1 hypothetical protein CSC70_03770 [Pseudoxanthomonas kalamensis DSM 18571]
MSQLCPHCQFPFDADWPADASRLCPRCGKPVDSAAAKAPTSLATLLRVPAPELLASEASTAAEDTVGQETVSDDVIAPSEPESDDEPLAAEAEETPELVAVEAVEITEAVATDVATPSEDIPEPADAHLEATSPDAVDASQVVVISDAADESAETLPSFTRPDAAPRPPVPRWQWALLIALALLLGLQVLLADRARLAGDPEWRPVVETLCNSLGCELPAWREPQAFAMLSRDVRPVPERDGALQVQASFRNDARWAQPWPVLVLSLSDADGRVVATRAFQPDDYLSQADADSRDAADTLILPGQSAQIAFRLREPSTPAVAFAFEFR